VDGAGVGRINVGRRGHVPMLTVACDADRSGVDTCQEWRSTSWAARATAAVPSSSAPMVSVK
jgi:hypothetical protein